MVFLGISVLHTFYGDAGSPLGLRCFFCDGFIAMFAAIFFFTMFFTRVVSSGFLAFSVRYSRTEYALHEVFVHVGMSDRYPGDLNT